MGIFPRSSMTKADTTLPAGRTAFACTATVIGNEHAYINKHMRKNAVLKPPSSLINALMFVTARIQDKES